MYSPPRRRRRGVWLLAVLSVAVVIVVLVTSFRSERRLLAAYIDTAQQSSAGAASAAGEFLDLVNRLGEVDRQEFSTTMARIRSEANAADVLLQAAEPPHHAFAAHARLELAFASWLEGLDLLEGATLGAADDPADPVPAELMDHAVVDMAVGDRAFEGAIDALLALEDAADVAIPSYPVVTFTPSQGAPGLLETARTASGLAGRRDLAVSAVGFEPRTLSETEAGVGILPFTDRLIVNVTVTNQGNQPAAAIPVQVLLSSDRSGTAASETVTVERLEPGEATSLEFVFEVLPVVNYELVINAGPVADEADTDNNLVLVPFVVNPEG